MVALVVGFCPLPHNASTCQLCPEGKATNAKPFLSCEVGGDLVKANDLDWNSKECGYEQRACLAHR